MSSIHQSAQNSLSIISRTCSTISNRLHLVLARQASRIVRASDLRLSGREFDPRPLHYRSVGTVLVWVTVFGRANHLDMQPAIQANAASYPLWDGKWVPGVKAGWLIPVVDKREGGRKNCVITLTRAIPNALEMSSHEKALYKCSVFNFFNFNFHALHAIKPMVENKKEMVISSHKLPNGWMMWLRRRCRRFRIDS